MNKIYYFTVIIVILTVFELYLRYTKPIINQSDTLLGWKLKPNLNLEFNQKNVLGNKYKVKFLTNERGSRFFGDEKKSEIKILVMGDSMTNGAYSSNNSAWFSVFAKKLEKKLNKKVYVEAVGSGGYGNFQQYLLAQKIAPLINPDFVILQFCNNDFYNNTYEWESNGISRNQFTRRPYLMNDNIYYHKGILSFFYNSYIFENIRFINRFDLFINLILAITYKILDIEAGMNFTTNNEQNLEYKKKSLKQTNLILSKIKKEFSNNDVFIFNMCDVVKLHSGIIEADNYPFNKWQNISENNNLIAMDFMRNIKFQKESFYKDTGHFSNIGNIQIGNEFFNHYLMLNNIN